jgi:hypothetical protein
VSDRRRSFQPGHDEHLGEARRSGGAYSPQLTHADLDAIVQMLKQQGIQDGVQHPKDGIDLGNPDDLTSPVPLYGTKPCPPVNLTIDTVGEEENIYADISWEKGTCVNNGAKFEVTLRRQDDPQESQFPTVRMTSELSLRFENLEPVCPYDVTVVAISNANMRSDALEDSFTSSADTSIPNNVTLVAVTSGLRTVLARWTDVVDKDVINGNGTYEVQIDDSSDFSSILKTVRVSGTVTAFTDLNPSTTYYVRVRAVDKSGNTSAAWSSTGNTTTGQAGTADIQAGAVTADLIAAGAVVTGKLAADSVTAAKLATITLEVGKYIESTTYSAGSAGWRINASGNAEFNNVAVRGTVISDSFQTVSSGARVRMGSALTAADEVQFLGSSGGIGSIRNAEYVLGYANSMRLSAGGVIDIYYDGTNRVDITASGGVLVNADTNVFGQLSMNSIVLNSGLMTVSSAGSVSAVSVVTTTLSGGGSTITLPGGAYIDNSGNIVGQYGAFNYLQLYNPTTGTGTEVVSVGASDSGGSGYRLLRVPNS